MTRFGTYLFSTGTHQGYLLVSSRFSTGDLNFCVYSIPLGSPVWKNRSCSEHQCIGLLEEHCCNYIMSMLNLQIHLLWASSRQHECGIKQNNLSESILPSVMLGWVTTFVCTSVCLSSCAPPPPPPTWICVYEFMNKKCFQSRHICIHACAVLWIESGFPDLPFQDGHKLVVCTDSVISVFSYKSGVHCWFCVCSSAALSFTGKYFSQHISIKSNKLSVCIPLWHKQAIVKKRGIHLTSKYCNMHKIMCSFC